MITGMVTFPYNAVDVIKARMKMLDPDDTDVLGRPVQTTDRNQTIAVFPTNWNPVKNSKEMLGRHRGPVLSGYNIQVQGLTIMSDQEDGLRHHSMLASLIRGVLYGDHALDVALSQLAIVTGQVRESLQKWEIQSQQFMGNRFDDTFMFLSSTDIYLETSTQ